MKKILKSLWLVLTILSTSAYATFTLDANGVTIHCNSDAVGATGIVGGVTYTKISLSSDLIFHNGTVDATQACTSGVTSMDSWFRDARAFYSNFNKNIAHFDTSSVTDMRKIFYAARLFNQDISKWDTSSVTIMSSAFSHASQFNQPIGSWNTSNVTNMSSIFSNASVFNQPLSNWNTSNVTTMDVMFAGAKRFNQPLSNWNTSKVTSMYGMFSGTEVFNQPIGNWDTSKVTNMGGMFYNTKVFNQPIGNWNTSSVTDMNIMFKDAKVFNQPLLNWGTNNVTNMNSMFSGTIAFNQPIGGWNTSSVTDMSKMFKDAKVFNQPIGTWDTSNVTSMNSMFSGTQVFNQPIGGWNTSKVYDMNGTFHNTSLFNQPLANWNTSNVTNMGTMFSGASVFNQPLANWNTSKVTNMGAMFSGASVFNQPLANWNTSKVTNMKEMFANEKVFNQPLRDWNTSKVSDMIGMFSGATIFNQDISNWSVPLIPTKPSTFDTSSGFENQYALQPWNGPNTVPVASVVSFTGSLAVGATLTGSYTYSDADNDVELGSTVAWYRSNDASGTNKTAITGATSTSYALVSADTGKFISFAVTPRNAKGTGSKVESAINVTAVKSAINVTAGDYAPVLEAISNINKSEDDSSFSVTLKASDKDGDTISYKVTSSNTAIATVTENKGVLTITPISNANGVMTITVVATANGKSDTKSFKVNIASVNDTPTITIDTSITTDENQAQIITFSMIDVDKDKIAVITTKNPQNGTVTQNGSTITYTPYSDFSGSDNFVLSFDDGNGGEVTKTIAVVVNPLQGDTNLTVASITKLLSHVKDTNITVDKNGDSTIIVDNNNTEDGFIYKAIVFISKSGKSNTKIIKINLTTKEQTFIDLTLRDGVRYQRGNRVEVSIVNKILEIRTFATINESIIID